MLPWDDESYDVAVLLARTAMQGCGHGTWAVLQSGTSRQGRNIGSLGPTTNGCNVGTCGQWSPRIQGCQAASSMISSGLGWTTGSTFAAQHVDVSLAWLLMEVESWRPFQSRLNLMYWNKMSFNGI